jgi:hypothetical protein
MGRMKIIGNTEEETGMELENIEFETSHAVIRSALKHCSLPQHDALWYGGWVPPSYVQP